MRQDEHQDGVLRANNRNLLLRMRTSPMRPTLLHPRIALFSFLLLAMACAVPTSGRTETPESNQTIAGLPTRRPGFWRITTISPEIGMQTNEVCIDERDSIVGALEENCGKPLVERATDQVIVTISCDRKGGREVTSILFAGDFRDWYRAQSRMTSTGANDGSIRRSGFTIEAKRLRPDCSPSAVH